MHVDHLLLELITEQSGRQWIQQMPLEKPKEVRPSRSNSPEDIQHKPRPIVLFMYSKPKFLECPRVADRLSSAFIGDNFGFLQWS